MNSRVMTVLLALALATGTGLAATRGPRLYVLDCGDIKPMDPTLFGLKKEEIAGDGSFVTPCYLVVHRKGTLIWDVGQVPDAQIPGDGTEVVVQDLLKARRKLVPQIEALGYHVSDIDFLAMSHYHLDHTANANLFAGSTWIVQKAERDAMFAAAPAAIMAPATFSALKEAKTKMLENEDFDVFGDGSVVVMSTPGHTPGHQVLFVKTAKRGPIVLAGDLYHYPEERTTGKTPSFEFNAPQSKVSRNRIEIFLKQTGAQLWIEHDIATHANLPKSPKYID